jgi:hypothetical protein
MFFDATTNEVDMAQYLDDIDYWTLSAADRLLLVQDILDSVLAENQDDALTPDLAGGRRWRLPRHLSSTYRRLNALSPSAKWIFDAVIHTLQNAEETYGPDGDEYISLMKAIGEEVAERAECCRLSLCDAE